MWLRLRLMVSCKYELELMEVWNGVWNDWALGFDGNCEGYSSFYWEIKMSHESSRFFECLKQTNCWILRSFSIFLANLPKLPNPLKLHLIHAFFSIWRTFFHLNPPSLFLNLFDSFTKINLTFINSCYFRQHFISSYHQPTVELLIAGASYINPHQSCFRFLFCFWSKMQAEFEWKLHVWNLCN
jgi:hypothetical protein